MDYRQKMVVPTSQKLKHEEEDDEDLEALRLAALKSLRGKHNVYNTQPPVILTQPVRQRIGYPYCPVYNHQRQMKRGYDQHRPLRQNGNIYYPSRVNQNLIEIIPVEGEETRGNNITPNDSTIPKIDVPEDGRGDSKFYRYKDKRSGSEDEDTKDSNGASTKIISLETSDRSEKPEMAASGPELKVQSLGEERRGEISETSKGTLEEEGEEGEEDEEGEKVEEEDEEEEEEEEVEDEEEEEEDEKPGNDDDDDVLLMADLEEEDSLERLMDEMEREMNVDKYDSKMEKKSVKRESKEPRRMTDLPKIRNRRSRIDRAGDKNGTSSSVSLGSSKAAQSTKIDRRSVSPRPIIRASQKRRSLSPKPRPRKKSPRRSPRRSPIRVSKKSFREPPRPRSPRRSSPGLAPPLPPSSRFSPRPRSPKSSPRGRSPLNRSPPTRRSPVPRKLSPRGRSPRSRSPRIRRSRSPRLLSRSPPPSRSTRSPKRSVRSGSPMILRSRSPKRSVRSGSPMILRSRSPRPRSPRSVTPRSSPSRAISPRSRSPRGSPRRLVAASPRPRSPKISSPERRRGSPARQRSPCRLSPHRSPWSSPRNSPRLSPRRRRSPKEGTRKPRARSITPEEAASAVYKRESNASPTRKMAPPSPEIGRTKGKESRNVERRETNKDSVATTSKDTEISSDPILEARRRKFECTKPIDPINDNKKIKLGKREPANRARSDPIEDVSRIVDSMKSRKNRKIEEDDYEDGPESELCLADDYVYEVLEDVRSDQSSPGHTVAMCVDMVPVKIEKDRTTKKKKKRDKEIYQVGKLKGESSLSERSGKEKKCKKRKDRTVNTRDNSPEPNPPVEDLTVDEEEADLRTELSRRRAERLNRAAPIQSARLLQSAFKGVVNEVAKTNAKVIQRHATKGEEQKSSKKEVRRVTVLHRTVADLPDSEDEATVDSKVPIRFRLGINKTTQEKSREPKVARKSSKRQGRKVKHKNNMSLTDEERKNE